MLHVGRLPALLLLLLSAAGAQVHPPVDNQWPTYGGDPGGQRYTASKQIDTANVRSLQPAWTFHTGILPASRTLGRMGSFETTPILFNNALYLTSPYDEVFSIDPGTGQQHWGYDPGVTSDRNLGIITSRGVASWPVSPAAPSTGTTACANRIFLGTLDARLIALDAANGQLCADFGNHGVVDLTQGVDYRKGDDYAITSPPTVIGDVVVVGSGIEDNLRVDVELGVVRGFDVHTGRLLWSWDPIPWAKNQTIRTGAGNTWSVISADPEHGLIYLPTSSASPDYYGGMRPGDDRDADSIVALEGKTGKKVWAFQVVHHNIWDYDIAAQPLLFNFRGTVPAVAVTTKMGLVFVLNRLTGEPLYKVTERPVPQSDVPGEVTSQTQPFPDLPPLNPIKLDMSKNLGLSPDDDKRCRALVSGLRYEGIYTPPSLRGSLIFPSNIGGVNWGSAAFDPTTGMLYADTNRVPYLVRLQKRPLFSAKTEEVLTLVVLPFMIVVAVLFAGFYFGRFKGLGIACVLLCIVAAGLFADRRNLRQHVMKSPFLDTGVLFSAHFGKEFGMNTGAPYVLMREPVDAPYFVPCSPEPFGTVSSLNLNTGQAGWQTPLGTEVQGRHTGTKNVGGPMVTAGGLVFTAASTEPLLRAFNAATGEELWNAKLPVPSQATPMSYTWHGRQYVVVAAGGHDAFGTAHNDSLIAFALP